MTTTLPLLTPPTQPSLVCRLSLLFLILATLSCQPQGQTPLLTAEERQWLAEHETNLTIAPDAGYAPIEFIDDHGEFKGIAADYVHLLEKRLGCRFSILTIREWEENVKRAKAKEFAIWSAVAPTPQKQEYMLFTKPYLKLMAALVVHSDASTLTLNSFGDRSMAVVDGYFTHDYLKRSYPGIRVAPVKNAASGLRAVAFKNVDAMLIDIATATSLIEQQGFSNLKVVDTMDLGYNLAFASRSDWPILNRILDAGLASITAEERQEIHRRWIHYQPGGLEEHRQVVTAVLIVIVLLLLFLSGIFLWNLSLRRMVAVRTRAGEAQRTLLQSILKSAPDGIGLVVNSAFTWTNQRMGEITGYSVAELTGKGMRLLYPNESEFQRVQKSQAIQLRSSNGMSSVETRWVKKDGSVIDILLCASWLDTTDEGAGVTVAALDITDRKVAELALTKALKDTEEEKEKNKAIIAALGDGISIQDTSFTVLYQNDIHKGLIGDRCGEQCYRAYEGKEAVCEGCPVAESFKDGAIHKAERSAPREGGMLYVDITASPLRNAGGEIIAGIELARDVTARKVAEKELAEEKERLAVTLRSIGDGVITTDTRGRVVLINKVAEELTGWPQAEAEGRELNEVFRIINEQTREQAANPVAKVLESGRTIGLANHTALISREGTERSIADSGAPIRDRESRIIGVVLVFRDVTNQNRLELELLKLKKLESIGILAGGIAHDFNNILMAILGNLNLANQTIPPESNAHTLINEAEKASLRARDLTQQLLTFSKGGDPVRDTASIAEVIRESAGFVLRGSRVGLRYQVPDDLWLVEIDKGQISQVIQNLIINADQAMPNGGTIEVGCRNMPEATEELPAYLDQNRRYIMITVHDSGPGIPETIIDKIFDPFFSTKEQGSGLGLAIAHGIINKHDGAILVHSTPGQGATFTIFLPASSKQASLPSPQPLSAPTPRRLTIMIMDDDDLVREVTQGMLTHLGHRVIQAVNGEEAIRLYRERMGSAEEVDGILMDLTIPGGMGGKETVREILQINPEAKVIVSSGYSNDPIMANCRNYGFSAAIVKPFRLNELTQVVNQVLAG